MSVMCSSPSTPPRSMKAPKSVMFFTTPFRVWPTWRSFMRTSRLVLRSASSSTRRETTMLRRRLLSLMILNSKLCPRSSSMLGTRRSAIWLPGRNASTPIRSTTTPPLIFFTNVQNDGGVGNAEHLRLDDLSLLDVGERPLVQLRHLRDFVRRILFLQIGPNADRGVVRRGGGRGGGGCVGFLGQVCGFHQHSGHRFGYWVWTVARR